MSRLQVIDDEEHERVYEWVAAIDVAKDAGVVCTRAPHPARRPAQCWVALPPRCQPDARQLLATC